MASQPSIYIDRQTYIDTGGASSWTWSVSVLLPKKHMFAGKENMNNMN